MKEYYNISTKISAWAKRQIAKICKAKNVTEYELLQVMCDTVIRYMDDRHNLTPEMEKAMCCFEHMTSINKMYNLTDPTVTPEVQEALYFSADGLGQKKGFRAHLIRKPFCGQYEETENIQYIFERVVELLLPEIYRKLRKLAIYTECNSLLELLYTMIDAQTILELDRENRETFEGMNHLLVQPLKKYIPHNRKQPEKIIFTDADKETADNEVRNSEKPVTGQDIVDSIGAYPIGVEP